MRHGPHVAPSVQGTPADSCGSRRWRPGGGKRVSVEPWRHTRATAQAPACGRRRGGSPGVHPGEESGGPGGKWRTGRKVEDRVRGGARGRCGRRCPRTQLCPGTERFRGTVRPSGGAWLWSRRGASAQGPARGPGREGQPSSLRRSSHWASSLRRNPLPVRFELPARRRRPGRRRVP